MRSVANSVVNALFSSLLVLLLIAGAFFFLYYLRAEGSRHDLVKSLKLEILAKKTLAQSLVMLPVIVTFVYVFSFTVLFTLGAFQKATFAYRDVAVPSFVFLIVLLMIVIASNMLFVPNLRKNIALLELRSRTAVEGLRYAKELVEKEKFETALPLFDILLEIDGKNRDVNELRKEVDKAASDQAGLRAERMKRAESDTEKEPAGRGPAGTLREPARKPAPEAGGAYERGLAEYERGNIHSALFYLERAVALHRDNREMKALYERVRREAERSLGALTKEEKERQRLVKEKEKGIGLFKAGKYFEAYDVFLPLSRRYPQLTDLGLYLAQAEEKILKTDFSPGEAKRLAWMPSTDNVVFLDRDGYLDTAGRVVTYKGDYYFYGVTRYRRAGETLQTARFAYGKWIEDRIVLKNDEGYVRRTGEELKRRTIRTFATPGYLLYARDVSKLKAQLNVFEYVQKSGDIRSSGMDVEDRYEYLAKSCGTIFAVYVLALVMAALAWSRRSIHDFPPFGRLFLFFVTVPPLCYFLIQLYNWMNAILMYTHQYAARAFLPKTSILPYTLAVNLAFSVCATLYYLSQSSKME